MSPNPPVPIYSFLRNHFDLVWRRCWRKPYEDEGLVYQPYSRVQRAVTDRMLDLAESKSAVVELEQSISLRDYLAHRRGAAKRIRALSRDGRFCMLACGEAILDSNQCSIETLARNLASGMTFARRVTGVWPKVGARFDSFGSSAQLPQIYRQCGIKWVTGFSYAVPTAKYWKGLDGSVVCVIPDSFPGTHQFLDHCYHEPCPHCNGRGCAACESVGIDLEANKYPERSIELPEGDPPPFLVYWVQSEEMLPDPSFPDELPSMLGPGFEPRWGGLQTISRHFQSAIESVDEATDIDPRVEFNPVQTGTYVTRMRVKSAARKAERFFFTAEAACTLAALGSANRTRGPLRRAWLDLPLLFFHDAVTGTHNDPAQHELLGVAAECLAVTGRALQTAGLDAAVEPGSHAGVFSLSHGMWQEAELPAGTRVGSAEEHDGTRSPVYSVVDQSVMDHPRLHALRSGSKCRDAARLARRLHVMSGTHLGFSAEQPAWESLPGRGKFSTAHFTVEYDESGLVSVTDNASGTLLAGGDHGRPNTLVLEVDEGDPWGTRGADRRRTVLDSATNSFFLGARRNGPLIEITHGGVFEENKRFGREIDPEVFGLEWTKTVRLHEQADHVSFATEIYWKAANRRIRVLFPGKPGDDRAVYGIPGGYLERPRYEQTDRFLWSPDGDWPALDFLARSGSGPSLALFNKGAVGSRVEDGTMMISLLRSPAFGHCLERYAQNYPMPYGGIRDGGYHLLEYALGVCRGQADLPRVAAAAKAWNEPALLLPEDTQLPAIHAGHPALQVTAVKPAFTGSRAVLRLLNCSDTPVEAEVRVEGFRLVPCSLLETRTGKAARADGAFAFGPFQIRSFFIDRL